MGASAARRRAASRMDGVAVSEVSYDVDGWGTGTLWFADGVLVLSLIHI